ncbi:MAG TPA: hypothetical protein VLI72_14395 [Methylibium sp.]|nr:hypothetical protein [Methylibium sp.]
MFLSALQPAPSPLAPLSPGTAIGSFVLQRVLMQDDLRLCYGATGVGVAGEVMIEEFAPAAIAQRDDDGSLQPSSPAHADLWAEGLQALARESMRFERIGHGSLQELGAVWLARGTGYRVCADVPGSTLGETRAGMAEPPSEAWLRRLVMPLLDALEALHGTGGLHGNVQPDSIVIQHHGPAVLVDPGAVRLAIGARLPGPPAWPQAAFVAPELLQPELGGPIGPWSDLYALAATVRYCIAGSVPMGAGLDNVAALPSAEGWSTGLVAAIAHALARDPVRRPQSVAEFRREFEASPARPPLVAVADTGIRRMTANPVLPSVRVEPGERYSVWPRSNFGEPIATPPRAPAEPAVRTPTTMVRRAAARPRPPPRRRWPAALAGAVAGAALALGALQGLPRFPELLSALAAWTAIPPAQAMVAAPQRATGLVAPRVALPAPVAAPPTAEVVVAGVAAPATRSDPVAPDTAAAVPAVAPPAVSLAAIEAREPDTASVVRPAVPTRSRQAQATVARAAWRAGPAAVCSSRSNFSRYLCIKTQCETARFFPHRQCVEFRTAERLP